MFLESITLSNLLSYGESAQKIELQPLNVIVGPNGAGKSNLLEAIDLLRFTPLDLPTPIRDGGGVRDWLWKGTHNAIARIEAIFQQPAERPLRYILSFTESNQQFLIIEEKVERAFPDPGYTEPYFFYRYENSRAVLNIKGDNRHLQYEEIDSTQSIFSQRKDPDQYPELTRLGNSLGKIRLYREWSQGRYTIPRVPQRADLPTDFLASDASNLGLLLNKICLYPDVKQNLLKYLQILYDGIVDYTIHIEGGTVQIFIQEGRFVIPATRLSDGTLRYLCLLAVLCHPTLPPLLCIEEPELGLHPDVLPSIAQLLKEASQRTQLIVTTHSDILVDALSDNPESVMVASRGRAGTELERLNAAQLAPWLEQYRLGQLWTRGEIGGTRW